MKMRIAACVAGAAMVVSVAACPAGAVKVVATTARAAPTPAQLQTKCDKNDWAACVELAALCGKGVGVPQSLEKARALYDKACTGKSAKGCYNLGLLQFEGPDKRAALASFDRSCKGSWLEGCKNQAVIYFHGIGVPKDRAKALSILDAACNKGHKPSCDAARSAR